MNTAASKAGVSLADLEKYRFATYTDIFTLPQTKTECTHVYDTGVPDLSTCTTNYNSCAYKDDLGICWPRIETRCDNIKACDTWATYKKVMNCDWYVNLPIGDNVIISLGESLANAYINDVVSYARQTYIKAIELTLAESSVAAASAAFASEGVGAIPAFVATFGSVVGPNLENATMQVETYLTSGATFVRIEQILSEKITPTVTEECGWSEWTRL